MLKMKINDAIEFPITGYNRYISIQAGGVNAQCNFNMSDMSAYDSLMMVGEETITDIKIYSDDKEVYHIGNQNARLSNINENVYGEEVSISASIVFNPVTAK